MSPVLFVGDVGVRRAGGSVCSGASPRCSLSMSSEFGVGDVGGLAVGARLSPGRAVEGVGTFVWQDAAPSLRGQIVGELEVSVGPFSFPAGTCVGRVPAWILVTRTLGAPDLVRMPLQGFLQDSIPCSPSPLSGAAM